MTSNPAKDLIDLMRACAGADDVSWGLATLGEDIFCNALTLQQKRQVAERSLACGCLQAERLMAQYGAVPAEGIAQAMGVPVTQKRYDAAGRNMMIYFAQFDGGRIILSQDMILEIEALIADHTIAAVLGEFDVPSIFIAHELFHYLESQQPDIETRTMKVSGRGILRRVGTPFLASEIGAFAFAKRLTGIPFFPRALEVIGLYRKLPAKAAKIVQSVEAAQARA